VRFLHGVRDTFVRDQAATVLQENLEMSDVREEITDTSGRQKCNKGPRLKGATTSEGGEDIRQDFRENHRAGDREANSRVFCQDSKNECQNIVEEPATAQTKEETTHSLRARGVGAPTTLGSFAPTNRKRNDGEPKEGAM
jgi:hypothetical protein